MEGRIHLIEQKLLALEGAAFQDLCALYLKEKEGDLISFNKTGSQIGKQKTIIGTPDSFLRKKNGDLVFCEVTTVAKSLKAKILKDISKCLDEVKTGVAIKDISKIIYCFNSRLDSKDENEIYQFCDLKKIKIEFNGIDTLSTDICLKYHFIAKDILGIPVTTGQLLTINNFIFEYTKNASGLATPLDNIFLKRENELEAIKEKLKDKDLLIITGTPGVGKTKLVLEAAKKFILENEDYSVFFITNKETDISEDLRIQLSSDKNFLLIVDDANRQLINFKQIVCVWKENRVGNIKIIATVRDYARKDLIEGFPEINYSGLRIEKFSSEEIRLIISSDSFKILHYDYQEKIIRLADGNVRLAIMAAKLANEKQFEFLTGDVFELYDLYFKTFIRDSDKLNDKTLLKTLGIISFFFKLKIEKKIITPVLELFDIEYNSFINSLYELNKSQLKSAEQF